MNPHPTVALNASGGVQLLNFSQLEFDHRRLLQLYRRKEEAEAYFVDYIPPARDAITLPRSVVYVLVGVVLVVVATYAIVSHLIKDLMHDLAGNLRKEHLLLMSSFIYASAVCTSFKQTDRSQSKEMFSVCVLTLLTDWIFGPKPVEEDPEGGSANTEEERRYSISSRLMETGDGPGTEEEKRVPLPGFHQGGGGCCHPSTAPPPRSAITSSYCGEKRISTHSVTFACPVGPYATSL
ncbi:unnamed protein product [Menidia menidia]|uniref:(Atlantic silverside) hypothetical protein n=1 Tax=Menidia menidia TaxID=238744 RepID=A0A8S4AUZ4_9TELE|nr:unnamed protein product [Menidia menidia]